VRVGTEGLRGLRQAQVPRQEGCPNDKYVACSMGVLEVGNAVACKGRHGEVIMGAVLLRTKLK